MKNQLLQNDNIAFIGSSSSFISSIILEELLRAVQDDDTIEIKCVIDTFQGFQKKGQSKLRKKFEYRIKKVFNPKKDLYYYNFKNIERIAAKNNLLYFSPGKKINNRDFVEKLSSIANIVFSCGNWYVLKENFINTFEYCINYNNSLLPKYRGVGATPISIFKGKKETGYAFHILAAELDKGRILLSGSIPVVHIKNCLEYEWEKTVAAAGRICELLELIKKRATGKEQSGEPSYYSKKDFESFYTVENPENYTFEELQRIVRIFGGAVINGRFATRIIFVEKGIKIKDGFIRIKRITELPPFLYKSLKFFLKK